MTQITTPDGKREMTTQEQANYDARQKRWADASASRKLGQIKELRKQKLEATDYMASSDYTMPSYIKTWRQTLRDLPANHTNEDAYNLLLARNSDSELTHSVWTQPTD
jgi:hypothetical protein|tara:strand:+ start:742 stop:1065 length:324 start_codon:yes stop_codon:yes gene_type:complete